MKKLHAALPVIAGLLVLSACGSTAGKASDSAGAGSNRPADGSSQAAATATTEAAPANPKFGAAFTFDNGLAVTVSAPKPYTPSESAFARGGGAAVIFDITVVNGTKANYDPTLFNATLQSGNAEAPALFDSANGVNGSPQTAVLPGRETTFKLAFSVTNPADLVMQLRPGFEYKPAIFTS
ncbi:hypothetical protein RHODO2019_11085 [Rhodococcus antarcticus]|uniref:DUF4352 domain-containing protein n=1 Tax=Rhodococcus antarcticus TaxID=2987751 RepID=A0ABY6NWK9_9NOCA|nr:hypothetical protein [Rhodococcus antarcticus]UZJ23750.1 hypothetical protein RHODO2019_11085 [Rhodococcus antarcticus]